MTRGVVQPCPWCQWALSVGLAIAGAAACLAGPVTLQTVTTGEQTVLAIESDSLRLRLSPSQGGRITAFLLKPAGVEMVDGRGDGWGLFADMFSQQQYPGELQHQPYEHTVLQNGPDVVSIRLSRTSTGVTPQGLEPAVAGVRIEKTITLRAASPNLHLRYRLTNTTGRGKAPAFWVQSLFAAGKDSERNTYFRPSARGVDVTAYDFKSGRGLRKDDVRDPAAGWMATLNREDRCGLLFLLDYDYLRWPYNCQSACSTEWFYDKVLIPAGASWETEVTVVPLLDMAGVAYASDRVILDAAPAQQAIGYTVRTVAGGCHRLALDSAVRSVDRVPASRAQPVTFTQVGTTPQTLTAALDAAITPTECVIPFSLQGAGAYATGELVFSGRDLTVALLGGLGDETIYRIPVPAKAKRFLKPKRMAYRPSVPPRCLVVNGVYHRLYRVDQALAHLGWETDHSEAAKGVWSGHEVSFWPEDYPRIMGYRAVVLVDVDPRAIGDEGLEMLREFVRHGGGLLVVGGPFALPGQGMAQACLGEVLPVDLAQAPALTPLAAGGALAAPPGSRLFEGLGLQPQPRCLWSHDLAPAARSATLLSAGARPLLVQAPYGKGRVAVFLGTVLGDPPEGEVPFWQWRPWPECLARILMDIASD